MKSSLEEKVINQNIGEVPVENYLADLLLKIESDEVDLRKCETKIAVLKQMNNRHKNIIDAHRVEIKQMEFERDNMNQ